MTMDERIAWLAVGCVLGYIVRTLQEIKREVHEVDEIVTKRKPDEEGSISFTLVLNVMILVLFATTIWSALRVEQSVDKSDSAIAANSAQNDRIEEISSCNLEYTAKTIAALNSRTTYTKAQLDANVDVMVTQLEFFQLVLKLPPLPEAVQRKAAEEYVLQMDEFVVLSNKQGRTLELNDYPTNEELADCLGSSVSVEEEHDNDERERGTNDGG